MLISLGKYKALRESNDMPTPMISWMCLVRTKIKNYIEPTLLGEYFNGSKIHSQ